MNPCCATAIVQARHSIQAVPHSGTQWAVPWRSHLAGIHSCLRLAPQMPCVIAELWGKGVYSCLRLLVPPPHFLQHLVLTQDRIVCAPALQREACVLAAWYGASALQSSSHQGPMQNTDSAHTEQSPLPLLVHPIYPAHGEDICLTHLHTDTHTHVHLHAHHKHTCKHKSVHRTSC